MTQGWGHDPSGDPTGDADDDATRSFPPVTPDTGPGVPSGADLTGPPPVSGDNPFRDAGAWGRPGQGGQQGGQDPYPVPTWSQPATPFPAEPYGAAPYATGETGPGGGTGGNGNGLRIAVVVLVVLLVVAVGVILATQWNSLFGKGDSSATGVTTTTVTPPPADAGAQGDGTRGDGPGGDDGAGDGADSGARPTDPGLPGGVLAVNAAARNGEPVGNFNAVWKSGPTSDDFAVAVRDAFVDAYLDNRETSQTVNAYSPATYQSYAMTCTDTGSYVHCTGGNNANVYIA